MLHERLDATRSGCARCSTCSARTYHWSLRQAEYSTDLMFRSQQTLVPL